MSTYIPPTFDFGPTAAPLDAGLSPFISSPSIQRDLPNLPSISSGFVSPNPSPSTKLPGVALTREASDQKTMMFSARPLQHEFRTNLRRIIEAEENTKDRMILAREQERSLHLRNSELEDILHDLKEEVEIPPLSHNKVILSC